jgi:hypothetical protein
MVELWEGDVGIGECLDDIIDTDKDRE